MDHVAEFPVIQSIVAVPIEPLKSRLNLIFLVGIRICSKSDNVSNLYRYLYIIVLTTDIYISSYYVVLSIDIYILLYYL